MNISDRYKLWKNRKNNSYHHGGRIDVLIESYNNDTLSDEERIELLGILEERSNTPLPDISDNPNISVILPDGKVEERNITNYTNQNGNRRTRNRTGEEKITIACNGRKTQTARCKGMIR